MANNIANKLVVKGKSAEDIEKFLNDIQGVENDTTTHIDFNKIVPMPDELIDTSESTHTSESLYYYLMKTNKEDMIPKLISHSQFYSMGRFDKCTPNELKEYFVNGEKYFNLYLKYDHCTWYDWRLSNWGTKWNAYDSHIEDCSDGVVEMYFYTAWRGVPELISILAKKYPHLSFDYLYADEDVSYNCGKAYTDNDGNFIFHRHDGTDTAMGIYIECWQEDWDNFKKTENGWEYNWEDEDE